MSYNKYQTYFLQHFGRNSAVLIYEKNFKRDIIRQNVEHRKRQIFWFKIVKVKHYM